MVSPYRGGIPLGQTPRVWCRVWTGRGGVPLSFPVVPQPPRSPGLSSLLQATSFDPTTGRPYQEGHPQFTLRSRGGAEIRVQAKNTQYPAVHRRVTSPDVSSASCRDLGSETSWNMRAIGPGWDPPLPTPIRSSSQWRKEGCEACLGGQEAPSSSSIFMRLLPPCSHLVPP